MSKNHLWCKKKGKTISDIYVTYSDTDLKIKAQTLCFKRAPTKDIYKFDNFFCLSILASSKKLPFVSKRDKIIYFLSIKQKHLSGDAYNFVKMVKNQRSEYAVSVHLKKINQGIEIIGHIPDAFWLKWFIDWWHSGKLLDSKNLWKSERCTSGNMGAW